jgi:hypothetical protein
VPRARAKSDEREPDWLAECEPSALAFPAGWQLRVLSWGTLLVFVMREKADL